LSRWQRLTAVFSFDYVLENRTIPPFPEPVKSPGTAMSRPIPQRHLRRFGTVALDFSDAASDVPTRRYSWRPDPEIWRDYLAAPLFPIDLAMNSAADPGGFRRFTPINGSRGLVAKSAVLGSVILDRCGRTRPEDDLDNASAVQLWIIASSLREYFGRNFKRVSDLQIARNAGVGSKTVLPERLGAPRGSNQRGWTITKLLRIGKAAAKERTRRRDIGTFIQYGLYEAAKLEPIEPQELTQSRVRGLLRQCLFDFGPAEVPDGTTRRLVRDRLNRAMQRHGHQSNAEFQKWITKDFANIVHQIAKKTKPGGEIDRAVVRQALLEDCFDAHFVVARGMDQGMRLFAALFPDRLNRMEKLLFSTLYFSQPWLGGLTLAMLLPSHPWLRPAGLDVMDNPRADQARGALGRLLQYYGEMTRNRREADREIKRRRFARNVGGGLARAVNCDVNRIASRPSETDQAAALIEHIAATRSVGCKCRRKPRWQVSAVKPTKAGLRVALNCERCGEERIVNLTKTTLGQLRREMSD
jgi:hypothetical protein